MELEGPPTLHTVKSGVLPSSHRQEENLSLQLFAHTASWKEGLI